MRIVQVLDDGLAGVQLVSVRHVVQEQQQLVRTGRQRLVDLGDRGPVLPDVPGAGRDGAVHADALFVGAMPLSPAVALGCLHRHAVVIAHDVGEGLQAERTGVVLEGPPRA